MPLHIRNVDADLDVVPPKTGNDGGPAVAGSRSMDLDIDRLRPIVLQILDEAMTAFQRQQG